VQLRALVDVLQTRPGEAMFRDAYVDNMRYKVARYAELQRAAEMDVHRQIDIIDIKMPELKRVARVCGDHDNWQVFESVSSSYRDAKDRAAAFESIKLRAQRCLQRIDDPREGGEAGSIMCRSLVGALHTLSNFPSQSHIVNRTVEIVSAFFKDPRLLRSTLFNFILLGGPGTGKTTLASCIGDVFAKAGLFVGDRLVYAGRAELVGQYEGQTVARTRAFLLNNLDNGVVFIDEAYAITPWQDGKPEGYGSEAAAAMVEFMTQYPGLYCIILAGYELQMTRYFLPTNDGLSRRFPHKYVLQDMQPEELVKVFQRSIMVSQGLTVPNGNGRLASEGYFQKEAWTYLLDLLRQAQHGRFEVNDEYDAATRTAYRQTRRFHPRWNYLFGLFQNQAGSMVSLADEAVTVIMSTVHFDTILSSRRGRGACHRPEIAPQGLATMRRIVVHMLVKTSLSEAELALRQLVEVERILPHRHAAA
jgi:hypothetical protein